MDHDDETRKYARRFRSVQEVDRGGIGRIDAADDPVIGRRVAIKTLLPELHEDPASFSRFGEEAQITGQLEHPNIVPVYDLGEGEDGPFIVMKLIRGKSLAQLISDHGSGQQQEPLQRFIQTLLRLCDALSFAHSRGVFHCDLKPDNVMVGDYGQVYLMDWGVALLRSRRDAMRDTPPSRPPPEWGNARLLAVRVTPRLDSGRATYVGVLPTCPSGEGPRLRDRRAHRRLRPLRICTRF